MSDRQKTMTGTYRATANAYGFFSPQEGGGDYFVPPRQSGGAWDGDTVTVETDGEESGEGRTVAHVTAVTSRAHQTITGVLRREHHQSWLEPADPKLPSPILITGGLHNAHNGDRVAARLTSYACGHGQTPAGELTEIFGPAGEFSSLIDAILYDHDVHMAFPDKVMEQAMAIPDALTDADLAGRLDLRDKTIITIDGASSRDFDDAVSLEREGDKWVLGVHIADVSHYVTPKTPLDLEAWERGTSVYFADRVAPMLPIALSNGICSLNPHVDRLALSCFMTMDDRGNILAHKLAKSVIRSTERMTYEDCNTLLDGADPALAERYAHILPLLRDMAALAATRTKKRRQRGALTLESSELTVLCDDEGNPVGLTVREPGRSESLIEEFMLCANETVAKHLADAAAPCVYRVHEKPSADKLENLRAVLSPLGYQVGEGDSFALQKVVDAASGKPEAPMINTLLLRTQKKARYDSENLGHFALAADYYCHFTSPIRRYPDLMVHRAITALLDGTSTKALAKAVEPAAHQSSLREVAATETEREVEKRYAAKFLANHLGETFPGAVSGVTRFGLFVLLSCGAEGLLPLESLPQDEYDYNEGAMILKGAHGVSYTIGTPLTVLIAAADPESGQVDLALEGVEVRPRLRVHRPQREERRPAPRAMKKKPPLAKPGKKKVKGRNGRRGKR